MKRALLLLTFALITVSLTAQYPGKGKKEKSIKGKITGKVLDPQKKAVAYATIVLIDTKTQKQVNGNITDEKGKFKLTGVKTGSYQLTVSFLGYLEKEIKEVNLTLEKPDFNAGTIVLEQDNVTLSEVEVVEEAPLVETKIDKIVYNAEKDITNAGGDASDVLRKVPMLSVDLEGNVSLRGSQNLRILINGKPSGMFASGTADALKMIPADQIKSVEVITSPSAKYDGEGSGGIINIITQKKQVQGYNISVNGSVGTRQNNGNVGINATKGRLGFNANAGFWHSWPNDATSTFLREDFDGETVVSNYIQEGKTNTSRTGFFGRAGLIYDINAFHNISSSINWRGHSFDTESLATSTFNPDLVNQVMAEVTERNSDANSLKAGFDWSTDYRRTFKQEGREFNAAFLLNGNVSNLESDISSSSNTSILDFLEYQQNDGDNREYTGQIDYVHPFGKKVKLEIGGKSVLRRIKSEYLYEQFDADEDRYIADPDRTNVFDYEQDVYAGYASFTINLPKDFGIVAGARYEHTSIGGEFESQFDPFDNSYDNLLPSIIISKKTNMFSSIKLSYNQRIQRPSLFYINPYRNDIDRRNVSQGNPELEPELVHQVELGYNTFVKGLVVSSAVYYKHTEDLIESIVQVNEEGVAESVYQNIGINNSIGFNTFVSKTFNKVFTIRGNFNIYTYNAESELDNYDLSNDGLQYNFFASSSYTFKKGWKAEAFGFYRAARRTLQGEQTSFWMTSVGFQKEFWKKRASLGIRIVDPFNKYKTFTTDWEGDNFTQNSKFKLPFRSFGLNFRYTFGKLDFKARQSRSKIKNDDQKSGGEGQQGGGGQGGGN